MQPVSRTAAGIERMQIDLSRIHAGTWRNRPVWVVGTTSASDTTTPQFWVDQERNVVVRAVIQPNEPVGPAWLATKITMAVNGRVIQTEEYSDWKTNVALPAALFDVASWTSAPHWARK